MTIADANDRSTLKTAFDKLKLAFYTKGYADKPSYIKEIGYEWEHFGIIQGDSAVRVDVADHDVYAILYKAPADSFFPPHYHLVSESGVVLEGDVVIKDAFGKEDKSSGDPFQIPKNHWHDFYFKTETLLFLQFHPPFAGGDWYGVLKPKT